MESIVQYAGWMFEFSVACAVGFGVGATFVTCLALVRAVDLKLQNIRRDSFGPALVSLCARVLVLIAGLQAVGFIPTVVFSSKVVQESSLSPLIPVAVAFIALMVVLGGGRILNRWLATIYGVDGGPPFSRRTL